MIVESLQAGLSARRIFQDLQTEKSYPGGYESNGAKDVTS